jgi:hypothetical protein
MRDRPSSWYVDVATIPFGFVAVDGTRRYLRSRTDDIAQQDELLLLPHWNLHKASRKRLRVR